MMLYKKELGRVLKSWIFILTVIGIVAFVWSQDVFNPSPIMEPKPGMEYGSKASKDPEKIMPEAAQALFGEYSANQYTTYPSGFIKHVRLNQADEGKMAGIMARLAGGAVPEVTGATQSEGFAISGDHFSQNADGSFQIVGAETSSAKMASFSLDKDITWEQFQELMDQADVLLGGGSDYATTWLSQRFGRIPITYEEALEDYELTVSRDQYTGAYARLFCDYEGIILALLSAFPAVFLFSKDRKAIAPMLYTRKVPSAKLIAARYLALVTAIMVPVLLMGGVLTVMHGNEYGFGLIDPLAYLKYSLFWLLPTVLASVAMGVFVTVLTGTPLGIAVQLAWWFKDMMGFDSSYSFFGTTLFKLVPRHNGVGQTGAYLEYLPGLVQNRIAMALAALLLVGLSALVFNLKRKGDIYAPTIRGFKNQLEV